MIYTDKQEILEAIKAMEERLTKRFLDLEELVGDLLLKLSPIEEEEED